MISFIDEVASKYLTNLLENEDPAVIQCDAPHYVLYLEEIGRLYHVTKSNEVAEVLRRVLEQDQQKVLDKYTSEAFKKELKVLLDRTAETNAMEEETDERVRMLSEEEEKKKKMQAAREKKMQKFKQKQQAATQNFQSEERGEKMEEEPSDQQDEACMICKLPAETALLDRLANPLCILSFAQKTSIICRSYLGLQVARNQHEPIYRPSLLVTSCNHSIHQQCYAKTYGNRDYLFCNLCKNSSNLLLLMEPPNTLETTLLDRDPGLGSLERMSISLAMLEPSTEEGCGLAMAEEEIDSDQEFLRKQAKELEEKLSTGEQILDSLVTTILHRSIADSSRGFVKSQLKTSRGLLTALRNDFLRRLKQCLQGHQEALAQGDRIAIARKILLEMFENLARLMQIYFHLCKGTAIPNVRVFRECYKFVFRGLTNSIAKAWIAEGWEEAGEAITWANLAKKETMEEEKLSGIDVLSIPVQLTELLVKSIQIINRETLHPPDCEPYQPFSVLPLPSTLDVLSSEIGQCPFCQRISNEIAVCLLCNGPSTNKSRFEFKSCAGCSVNNLMSHSIAQHAGSCVFIRVDSGIIITIGGGEKKRKNWLYPSIYRNFLMEPYSNNPTKKEDKSKYQLDNAEYQRMFETLVLRHRIEQEIRYMEATQNRKTYAKGLNEKINVVY